MQAEIMKTGGEVLEVATGTEEEIRARFAALDGYCLNWIDTPDPVDVPSSLCVAPAQEQEPARVKSFSEERYRQAVEGSEGFCTVCRQWTRDCTEPDAEEYDCPQCENKSVVGAENALIGGHITIKESSTRKKKVKVIDKTPPADVTPPETPPATAAFENHKPMAALKRLLKTAPDRLFSDGKGMIASGHWLVLFSTEVLELLPTHVEIKAGPFPLREPASLRSDIIETGENANLPVMEQVAECIGRTQEKARFAQEGTYVKLLQGQTLDVYQLVQPDNEAAKPVHLNAVYVEAMLGLNKTRPVDFLHFGACEVEDDLSPAVLRVCYGVDAIIMPVRA